MIGVSCEWARTAVVLSHGGDRQVYFHVQTKIARAARAPARVPSEVQYGSRREAWDNGESEILVRYKTGSTAEPQQQCCVKQRTVLYSPGRRNRSTYSCNNQN